MAEGRRVARRGSSAPGASRYRKDEDEPTGRRRGRDEEDDKHFERDDDDKHFEDEKPRGRRGRSRDDEDDEEDRPRSRGRSRGRDDEDEDDKPRGRRSRRDEEDEDEPRGRGRGRSSRDDEEEEDELVGRGWKDTKNRRSKFADRLELEEEEPLLIKFLEDEPFVTYARHWIQALGKYFFCLERDEDGCPLCDEIGDEPGDRAVFNVVVLVEGNDILDKPSLVVWDAPPTVFAQLRKYNEDDRKGPLTRHYWEVIGKNLGKKKGKTEYSISMVKERDLEDDWSIEALSDDELDAFERKMATPDSYPYVNSREDLEEAVDELLKEGSKKRGRGDDDDDDRSSRRSRRRR